MTYMGKGEEDASPGWEEGCRGVAFLQCLLCLWAARAGLHEGVQLITQILHICTLGGGRRWMTW